MSKPDAALLWARERAAQRHPSRSLALEILAGKQDNYSVVTDFADAYRAGQAHTDGLVAAAVADAVCLAVSELPDRTSPEGWLEAMLVTHDELHVIVTAALTAAKGQQ